MNLSQDTHYYENKLSLKKQSIDPYIVRARSTEQPQKRAVFEGLKNSLSSRPTFNHNAAKYLGLIINDQGTMANFDNTHGIYAEDLLYILAVIVKEHPTELDIQDLINDVLEEINNGPCNVGRVFRLFQVICALEEFLKIEIFP